MMPCVVCSCSAYAQWRHCLSSDMWLVCVSCGCWIQVDTQCRRFQHRRVFRRSRASPISFYYFVLFAIRRLKFCLQLDAVFKILLGWIINCESKMPFFLKPMCFKVWKFAWSMKRNCVSIAKHVLISLRIYPKIRLWLRHSVRSAPKTQQQHPPMQVTPQEMSVCISEWLLRFWSSSYYSNHTTLPRNISLSYSFR